MLRIRLLFRISILAVLAMSVPAAAQWTEQYWLTSHDSATGDYFGESVAISGEYAIVGTRRDDDDGSWSGGAYVFNATTGEELRKLTADDAETNDCFGYPLDIDGNLAIIAKTHGAWGQPEYGSAYVFDVTNGNQLRQLTVDDVDPPGTPANDWIDLDVGIFGNTAIIGAQLSNDAGANSGTAHLFNATTGDHLFQLTATGAAAGDRFGRSVDISGDTAVVGAGNGSAYVFNVSDGTQRFELTADPAVTGTFPDGVAVDGDVAIVGADDGAYLFNVRTGEELFKLAPDPPAAGVAVAISGDIALLATWGTYAYLFDVKTGEQIETLTPSVIGAGFGDSLGIAGNIAIVGASHSDRGAGNNSGEAWIFSGPDVPDPEPDLPGDANDSGFVDDDDLAILLANWTGPLGTGRTWGTGDFEGDGDVAHDDLAILLGNWTGSPPGGAAVPEPATMVLLSLGGLSVLRRRRR